MTAATALAANSDALRGYMGSTKRELAEILARAEHGTECLADGSAFTAIVLEISDTGNSAVRVVLEIDATPGEMLWVREGHRVSFSTSADLPSDIDLAYYETH
ncbi:hypothetical protein IU500_07035 [Nocardia terpenica]|uniref:hypothetical protein n=1 Tax=Nocardia terpenica TaxID=455432 RepID=UPI001895599C|nr:hypothetical protein [Nocardia terpenica]MBF6060531.1 hypothetical protein [Nocardia terpenica]MBF6103791.1 hypothetical protein [Nocardia terpenica]MBF6111835.1 hypothetical protein [Nocardia terpenica]MBF6118012.1 hypothetical protein [Nocardia terpenica]MBF6155262.1 hypothetical protein [Nocardia terpenica]